MRPPKIEKPTAGTAGSNIHPSRISVSPSVYRPGEKRATFRKLTLLTGARFAPRVLQRAVDDVRRHVETLPLWAYRLAQHVNRGVYGYQEAWNALEAAAIEGGASESWARRTLFSSFAKTVADPRQPMPLRVLVGGLH